ncbi:MAG: DUF4058 family protein [Planctomycetota bacterium]|nr:DUF4058 family protein [Planctomycetota bacterium]
MPSPFPGMDPYLEYFWRDVHTALTVYKWMDQMLKEAGRRNYN